MHSHIFWRVVCYNNVCIKSTQKSYVSAQAHRCLLRLSHASGHMHTRFVRRLVAFAAAMTCFAAVSCALRRPSLPTNLEPEPGVAQCNYDLLHAFVGYMEGPGHGLRYTLGAGTLLGAMRNDPPGLLQWEHDVDVYMPARDAHEMIEHLARDCGMPARRQWRSHWCSKLLYRGLVDAKGAPCCGTPVTPLAQKAALRHPGAPRLSDAGFGLKLFHRETGRCELDVLVLAAAALLQPWRVAPSRCLTGGAWPGRRRPSCAIAAARAAPLTHAAATPVSVVMHAATSALLSPRAGGPAHARRDPPLAILGAVRCRSLVRRHRRVGAGPVLVAEAPGRVREAPGKRPTGAESGSRLRKVTGRRAALSRGCAERRTPGPLAPAADGCGPPGVRKLKRNTTAIRLPYYLTSSSGILRTLKWKRRQQQ